MPKVLVSGCAGYIGQIVSQVLLEKNYTVIGLDNFSCNNSREILHEIIFYEGCISDANLVKKISKEHKIDFVIHLASFSSVEESTVNSKKYLRNNFEDSISFLNSLYENDINKLVFASTAAIYGECLEESLSENHEVKPNSPYAQSKLNFENHLNTFQKAQKDFSYIALRLFNVSGSYGKLGERHDPETYLIPCAVDALLQNKELQLFGKNFNTKDGTAVRDYVHVVDVANSFIQAGNLLNSESNNINQAFNIGSGETYSNLEIIELIKELSSKNISYKLADERAGDLPRLKANNSKATKAGILNLENSDIEKIVKDNLDFRSKYLVK